MKDISIKTLIEFRRKSKKAKRTLVSKIKSTVEKKQSEGGNYWTLSISAINKAFKNTDPSIVDDKIQKINEEYHDGLASITKGMYKSNIAVLTSAKRLNWSSLSPKKIEFLRSPGNLAIFNIKGKEVVLKSRFFCIFRQKSDSKVGAVWFLALKYGYTSQELGIYSEALFKFLESIYGEGAVLPEYCIAAEMTEQNIVRYSQIQSGEISEELLSVIDELSSMM